MDFNLKYFGFSQDMSEDEAESEDEASPQNAGSRNKMEKVLKVLSIIFLNLV